METTDKQRAIDAIENLPDQATIEDAIERLCFIAKIEDGLNSPMRASSFRMMR